MNNAKSKRPAWAWAIPVVAIAVVAGVFASTMAQASLDDSSAAKSQEYVAELNLQELSVALQEDGVTCEAADGASDSSAVYTGLMRNLNGGNTLSFGKHYDYDLSAANDGAYDEYVRVVVNKYWQKPDDDKKGTQLEPELIEIDFDIENWVVVDSEDDPEQVILYSKNPVPVGQSLRFVTGIGISADLLGYNTIVPLKIDGVSTNFTTTEYTYGPYNMCLDVEVSAVQTGSTADAIKSAWGIDINQDPYRAIVAVD